jgi:2-polyprenyl-6-hydroxyphenyl methylase/3-demethylubiquinone-9 3-methyltransferase
VCASPTHSDGSLVSKFSGVEFCFAKCSLCGFGFVVNPRLDFERLYNDDYYIGKGADPLIRYGRENERFSNFDSKLRSLEYISITKAIEDLVVGSKENIKVLDFGGGFGGLTKFLGQQGFKVDLFEVGYAADFARMDGVDPIDVIPPDHYDVIVCVEVLEHLVDPITDLSAVLSSLKTNGLLIITTGNFGKTKKSLSNWYYSQIPDVHVSFWTRASLLQLFSNYNLIPVQHFYSSKLLQYKIIKNLYFKRFFYRVRFFLLPFTRFTDIRYGVSEIGFWRKLGNNGRI